jgi:hypothetical protein
MIATYLAIFAMVVGMLAGGPVLSFVAMLLVLVPSYLIAFLVGEYRLHCVKHGKLLGDPSDYNPYRDDPY